MTQSQTPAIYRVPATAEDMRPPKQSTLITEAANFLRAHWDEVRPYYQSLSGEVPSIHGDPGLDEADCVFEIKRKATENGFAFLGSVPTIKLKRALRFAFKRNTGTSMRVLKVQHKRLQIERRQAQS
jgi:hypothetical protein